MKILLCAMCLALVGCTIATKLDPKEQADVIRKLSYMRDPATGMCFATVGSVDSGGPTNGFTLTWVPCDPQVLKVIK